MSYELTQTVLNTHMAKEFFGKFSAVSLIVSTIT